jgi:lysophospholipase L1-like esterase
MMNPALHGYLSDYVFAWLLYASLLVHAWCFFRFFPTRRLRRLGLVLGNAVVFLCLLGTIAMVAETYLRFFSMRLDPFGMTLPARRWNVLYVDQNSWQCRDPEWEPAKPAGTRRIAFVGDSFTYGWGVADTANRFTGIIQRRFQRAGPGKVEVMNVARPGWGSEAQALHLPMFLDTYAVDEVVLCYVPNDIESHLPVSEEYNPTIPPMPRVFDTRSSALIDWLYWRVYVPRVATVRGYHDWLAAGYADPDIWRRQEATLDAVLGCCRERGVRLRVVLLPFLRTGGTRYDAEAIHERVADWCIRHDVPVVDPRSAIADVDPDELTVNADDAHPNEHAHRLFADRIWTAFFAAE